MAVVLGGCRVASSGEEEKVTKCHKDIWKRMFSRLAENPGRWLARACVPSRGGRQTALGSTQGSLPCAWAPRTNGRLPPPPPQASLGAGSLGPVGSEAHLPCSAPPAPCPAKGIASAAPKSPALRIIKTMYISNVQTHFSVSTFCYSECRSNLRPDSRLLFSLFVNKSIFFVVLTGHWSVAPSCDRVRQDLCRFRSQFHWKQNLRSLLK